MIGVLRRVHAAGGGARLRDTAVVDPEVHVRELLGPLLARREHRILVAAVERVVALDGRLAFHERADLRLQRPQLVARRVLCGKRPVTRGV